MVTLTIEIPDEQHLRLKELAERRGVPLVGLVSSLTSDVVHGLEMEDRFNARAALGAGKGAQALALLDKALGKRA